jgi:hypothetical protein
MTHKLESFHVHIVSRLHSAESKQASYTIMTMLLFARLAKARHVTENINDSNLVAVRHTIDHVDSGYNRQRV